MARPLRVAGVLALLLHQAGAFVSPAAFVVSKQSSSASLQQRYLFSPLSFGDDLDLVVETTTSRTALLDNICNSASSSLTLAEGIGETIKTVLYVLTGILFLGAGIVYITASIIIPKAAEQVEQQAKELAPELWAEYEAQLAEGETLAMRPELMQELGEKIQPLMEAKFEKEYAEKLQKEKSGGGTAAAEPTTTSETAASPASTASTSSSTVEAVDVEIIEKTDDAE